MTRTWLTRRLGIDVPLIQAPMAGISGGRLAAAVSAAGGLGMVGVGYTASGQWVAAQAEEAHRTERPFGIGLLAWVLAEHPDQLEAALESTAAVVSVSFGPFEQPVRRLQEAGKVVTTQVGNLAEARRAQDAGVDFVVARGAEAGGHGRNGLGTLPLLDLVLDAVDVPVVAAGGIGTARGLAAVLAAGAAGAWVGTAFLGCPEATNTPEQRQRLFAAGADDTVHGRVFDIAGRAGWPAEYGGRALRNAFFDRWSGREDELAGSEQAAAELAAARRDGDYDIASIYAGQGVGLLRAERPAADVVAGFATRRPGPAGTRPSPPGPSAPG
jgi:nitronate monooxygenase